MHLPVVDLSVSSQGVVNRRGFLRQLGAGVAVGSVGLGFRELVAAKAAEMKQQGKAMILLWMDGGPSQFECFNPKPDSANQGPAKAIQTCLPGVQFAEYWPKTAQTLDKIALIRSMKSKEAEHDRAITHLRTGYPLSAAIRYPTWGSVVSMKRHNPEFDLPAFVRIGKPRIATRDVDAGALGVKYAAFKIDEAGQLPPDVALPVPPSVLKRRLDLAGKFDRVFEENGGQAAVKDKRDVYEAAARFVMSPRMSVFDLGRESDKLRDSYGRTNFGQGCLLARRLVERGVSFVEVISTGSRNDQGWDTHKAGFVDQPPLCHEVDPAYSTLLRDLADRGMLDNTLVVWMGEFGRTPKFKPDGGRDHYANGWLTCLSGGGVRGGQVIGATNKDGTDVTERPIGVSDLYMTFCKVLGINPDDEYHSADGRPHKIIEGGEVVKELFG